METRSKKIGLVALWGLLGVLALSAMTGCVTSRTAMVIAPPTCQEALGDRYHEFTDYEIAGLLDEAQADNCPDCLYECWIPLMKRCLDDSREIPQRHLLQAVKTFNQRQYSKYFHTAVYRYFYNLSRGRGAYRTVDRTLMRTYCSILVHDSHSQNDRKLSQAMELCHRLDPELYSKMFR